MKKFANLFAAVFIAAPLLASAGSVTYDFTGVVTSAVGSYNVAIGTAVTGTYTINVANGVPSQSDLPISTTAPWSSQEYTGTATGIPSSAAYVFSSTANVGQYAYVTTLGTYDSTSYVYDNGTSYVGFESNAPNASSGIDSGINLANTSNTIAGLPILTGVTTGTGYFQQQSGSYNSGVDYNITSIVEVSAVPLPAASWLMLSGLCALGAAARMKRH